MEGTEPLRQDKTGGRADDTHLGAGRQAGVLPTTVFAKFSDALSSGAPRSLNLSPESFQKGVCGRLEFKTI